MGMNIEDNLIIVMLQHHKLSKHTLKSLNFNLYEPIIRHFKQIK